MDQRCGEAWLGRLVWLLSTAVCFDVCPYSGTTNIHSPMRSEWAGEEEQRKEFEGWREQNTSLKMGLFWGEEIWMPVA